MRSVLLWTHSWGLGGALSGVLLGRGCSRGREQSTKEVAKVIGEFKSIFVNGGSVGSIGQDQPGQFEIW